MIRRALLIAAVVVMPAAALSAVTLGAGVAGAKGGGTPGPMNCATTGSVTFAKPGLSYDGSTTSKSTEESKSNFSSSTGGLCGSKTIKITVISNTTPCSQSSPTPPAACSEPKAKANYYDDTKGFTNSSTEQDIYNALAAGISTTDNGTKITLEQPTSESDVTAVYPGGACGSNNVGFSVSNGPVNDSGGPSLSWSSLTCLTTDTGTGTSGEFYPDLLSSSGGDASIVIAGAGIGGKSNLTISS